MKKSKRIDMKKIVFAISFLMLGWSFVSAQTSMNTSGGNPSSSSGEVSYSVGQVFYTSNSGSLGSISEGVQQPYEISTTLGVDVSEVSLSMKVFPNPTQDVLNLRIDFSDYKDYRYEMYDANNKSLSGKAVVSPNTVLSIASYPSALYYLKITKNNKLVKVFKIIKTDK